MNLSTKHADAFTSIVGTIGRTTGIGLNEKAMLQGGLGLGLNLLQSMTNTDDCAKHINARKQNSIRLLFPNLDFGYSYPVEGHNSSAEHKYMVQRFDEEEILSRRVTPGQLMPHIRLVDSEHTLRQWITHTCYDLGKSTNFNPRFNKDKVTISYDDHEETYQMNINDIKYLNRVQEIVVRGDGHIMQVI